jgi:hypothetical protein
MIPFLELRYAKDTIAIISLEADPSNLITNI